MNERIKELIEQSGAGDVTPVGFHKYLEKFAELIVAECLEQVWYTREDGINGNVSLVIKERIKQHFLGA